jgi:transcriptional regulator with XRE-family HTH domain
MTARHLLRRARRRAQLSQRARARLANVPQSTVARIELGTLSPRTDTLERLLRAAGQTLTAEPLRGEGVDRTLIRERLRLTPLQRLRGIEAGARSLRLLSRARRVERA